MAKNVFSIMAIMWSRWKLRIEALTQVFHALRQQRLERVQTVRFGVHALGQRVAQMHLVFKQQPRRWRARRWRHIRLVL